MLISAVVHVVDCLSDEYNFEHKFALSALRMVGSLT